MMISFFFLYWCSQTVSNNDVLPRDREWRRSHIGRLDERRLDVRLQRRVRLEWSRMAAWLHQPLIPPGPKTAQPNSVEDMVSACRRRHRVIKSLRIHLSKMDIHQREGGGGRVMITSFSKLNCLRHAPLDIWGGGELEGFFTSARKRFFLWFMNDRQKKWNSFFCWMPSLLCTLPFCVFSRQHICHQF